MNTLNTIKSLAAAMLFMAASSSSYAAYAQGTVLCEFHPYYTLDGLQGSSCNEDSGRIVVKGGKPFTIAVKAWRRYKTTDPWRAAWGRSQIRRNKSGLDEVYNTDEWTGSYTRTVNNRSSDNQTFFLKLTGSWVSSYTGLDFYKSQGTISTNDAP